jgi:hypothetical protein
MPKLRWENGLDQDIRILGVKNWEKVALDRDKWAMPLKKSRAHPVACPGILFGGGFNKFS